uniref:Uncharacterized protein n=1 Tax=Rhizophora mucronata TaxID=61149 RepID=A0A2P2KBT4_RHIMU
MHKLLVQSLNLALKMRNLLVFNLTSCKILFKGLNLPKQLLLRIIQLQNLCTELYCLIPQRLSCTKVSLQLHASLNKLPRAQFLFCMNLINNKIHAMNFLFSSNKLLLKSHSIFNQPAIISQEPPHFSVLHFKFLLQQSRMRRWRPWLRQRRAPDKRPFWQIPTPIIISFTRNAVSPCHLQALKFSGTKQIKRD